MITLTTQVVVTARFSSGAATTIAAAVKVDTMMVEKRILLVLSGIPDELILQIEMDLLKALLKECGLCVCLE